MKRQNVELRATPLIMDRRNLTNNKRGWERRRYLFLH